jgi:hypothetical protein
MSINQSNIIDAIGISHEGKVILTISDHHSWDETWHLQLLQDKINAYLRFIESGQILEDYPNAEGKEVVIETVMKYQPTSEATSFLEKANEIIKSAGFGFNWKMYNGN